MTLSGWTRLWIVASVIWWGAGGWWLADNFRLTIGLVEAVDTDLTGPNKPIVGYAGIDGQSADGIGGPPSGGPDQQPLDESLVIDIRKRLADKQASTSADVEVNPETYKRADTMRQIDQLRTTAPKPRAWLDYNPENLDVSHDDVDNLSWLLALAFVITAPFGAALAFIGVRATGRWIWRGFRLPHSTARQTMDAVAQLASPALLPEPDAAIEARTDASAKERRKPKSGPKPDVRDSNRQVLAEKVKRPGIWASIGIGFAVLLVGAVAQFATSLTKAFTAPAIEAGLPKLSAQAPSTIEPLAPGAPRAPDGFTSVALEDGAIRFDAPSTWPVIDTAIFAEADTIAASMLGASGGQREAIYSAAVSQITGTEPAATLHVLVENGPAPTQQQVRDLLAQHSPAVVDLPKKTAAYITEAKLPDVRQRTLLAEWADNERLICLHIQVEVVGDQIRKISDQWNCYNSSTAVTLTSVYDAAATATYAPIVRHVFDSLDLAIDHTIRLR